MPRDNDKNNDSSRGRRDRPAGGKGRSGAARGPEKKFAKRGFAGKSDGDKRPYAGRSDGDKRPYAGKSDGPKSYGKKPYSGPGKPYAGKREGPPPRRDGDAPRRDYGDAPRPRGDRPFADRAPRGEGEKRAYAPRGDRPNYNRDDRAPRSDARPAGRFQDKKFDKKFGDKRPYTPREGGGEKRPYTPRGEGFRKDGDRPDRKFGGDKKFSRGAPDRGPRKDFGSRPDRGESKPWQKRDASSPDHTGRNSRPPREGARNFDKPNFDKPRFDKPRFDKPRDERGGNDRPRFSRPREDRPKFERPRGDRPDRNAWQEHPRSEARDERPRRDNED